MRQIVQKTYATTPSVIERRWWMVDAKGMTLGARGFKGGAYTAWNAQALLYAALGYR